MPVFKASFVYSVCHSKNKARLLQSFEIDYLPIPVVPCGLIQVQEENKSKRSSDSCGRNAKEALPENWTKPTHRRGMGCGGSRGCSAGGTGAAARMQQTPACEHFKLQPVPTQKPQHFESLNSDTIKQNWLPVSKSASSCFTVEWTIGSIFFHYS